MQTSLYAALIEKCWHQNTRWRQEVRTAAADITLVEDSPDLQYIDPGGASRNVDLPAEGSSKGRQFIIVNTADAAETLTVREDAGATTIVTIDQNETALLVCDGTTWKGLVGVSGDLTAAQVEIADAGGHTAQTEVEGALQEVYQHILSAQATWPVNLMAAAEADGTVLAAFVGGASTTPGISVTDSEAFGIRWNNHATPDPIIVTVPLPQDLDDSADIVVHLMASKTGATLADAVTWTCQAFFLTDGALHDADADAGGASSAMTGDAAAKTVQEETLAIAAADVPASPSVLTLTIQPTDGTLGTDDVILEGVWLEYTRKILTS